MAQSESVRAFKNDLKSYHYNLSRIVTLQNSIDFCYHKLGADVRAIDYSREPSNSVPNKELEYKLRDDIERYEHLKAIFQMKVRYVDEILARIETNVREAIINVYVEHKKMEKVAPKHNISTNGLQYRIDKAIEGALDEKGHEEKI